jgi:hypothetical protein
MDRQKQARTIARGVMLGQIRGGFDVVAFEVVVVQTTA